MDKMPLVRDIMKEAPPSISPDLPVFEAVDKIVDKRLAGIPVIDDQKRLVATRSCYAGNVIAKIAVKTNPEMLTIRPLGIPHGKGLPARPDHRSPIQPDRLYGPGYHVRNQGSAASRNGLADGVVALLGVQFSDLACPRWGNDDWKHQPSKYASGDTGHA